MDIDGATQARIIKFKELVYTVETGEAEMISVDFVARGGGNATAVNGAPASVSKTEASKAEDKTAKGKGKQQSPKEKQKEEAIDETAVLTADDEESKFLANSFILESFLNHYSSIHTYRQSKCYTHACSPYQSSTRLPVFTPTIIPF